MPNLRSEILKKIFKKEVLKELSPSLESLVKEPAIKRIYVIKEPGRGKLGLEDAIQLVGIIKSPKSMDPRMAERYLDTLESKASEQLPASLENIDLSLVKRAATPYKPRTSQSRRGEALDLLTQIKSGNPNYNLPDRGDVRSIMDKYYKYGGEGKLIRIASILGSLGLLKKSYKKEE